MRKYIRRSLVMWLVFLPLVVIIIVPLLYMTTMAFTVEANQFVVPIRWIPQPPTLQNFRKIFADPLLPLGRWMLNSLTVALVGTPIIVFVSSLSGYAFARLEFPGRDMLFSVLIFSLGTLLTAVAQTAAQFVAAQMIARMFMLTASAVAFVIVTEEFPALHRGWAIGMLGALSACGNGLGAGLFAAIESLPYGWRALYAVGVVPLLLFPLLRRRVEETRRFNHHRALIARHDSGGLAGWYRPLVSLARTYPGRAMGVAAAGGLMAVGESAVFQFTGYFTLTVHGWSPAQFSMMFIIGGAVGIIGNVVAGRLGDRIGRRTIGCAFLALFPLFAWTFYHGPSWSLPISWTLFVFCNKRRDRLKVLWFDINGYCLLYKRLHRARFEVMEHARIDAQTLAMLMQGVKTTRAR